MATSNSTPKNPAKSAAIPSGNSLSFPTDTEDRLCRVSMAMRGAMQLLEALPDNGETSTNSDSPLSRALSMLEIVEHEVMAICATAAVPVRAEVTTHV